jgi:transitional endoplasmic reticulum ATPase
MQLLEKNSRVKDYTVQFFIKQGVNAQSYRVKNKEGQNLFLKIFKCSKLHRTSFDENGELLEIKILRTSKHPNIVKYIDSGEIIIEQQRFAFVTLEFITGETLSDFLAREKHMNSYEVKEYSKSILNGLKYLHTLPDPVVHNEITIQNVMLDLSGNVPIPKIIDFGYARFFNQSSKTYNKEGLNPYYLANECFNNFFSPQSDIFSLGVTMFHLLYGLPPWFSEISNYRKDKINIEDTIIEARNKPLQFPEINEVDFDDQLINTIKKALHPDTDIRFKSAAEMLNAINNNITIENTDEILLQKSVKEDTVKRTFSSIAKGKGFESIAGMKELKEQLQLSVIDAIKNPEKYKKYGVPLPNGILLYGPPRCGKTFFAKKFAEEVGFNYIYIKPSNLQSKYVNATQENIAKMFEEAEKNAPTIIFIDELDALVPNREGDLHQMHANAVNEMLAQMDRTGEKGIFIIGASNRPEKIDPAILGAGRLEKKFFIGTPDFEARKAMFEMYLKNRPIDFGINYELLAKLTENFVSGDIELIVNDSALLALKEETKITMKILEKVINGTKPSVSLSEIEKYNKLKLKMESDIVPDTTTKRNPVGFKTNNK